MFFETVSTDKNHGLTLQSEQPEPEPGDLEFQQVRTWIANSRLADLARFRPSQADAVARLCLEMAQSHPHEVTVLLWNQGVAEQAENLLNPEAQFGRFCGVSTEALARCLLNAGHSLNQEKHGDTWPDGVRELVTKRADANALYWQSKVRKFKVNPCDALPTEQFRGEKRFFGASKPFFYLNSTYSLENFNGTFTAPGLGPSYGPPVMEEKALFCGHWGQIIKDEPKRIFRLLAQKDISFLEHDPLQIAHVRSRRERGQRSVHFVLAQFGRLLTRIAHLVPPGARRSYALGYHCGREENWGHEMRLFIEKKPSVPDLRRETPSMDLKVYLYEPNVTGNMKHLRAWPEDLQTRSFEDFASISFDGVEVLSLALEDPALAQALAGQFVPHEVELQLSSFLNALASGNLNEMEAATRRLSLDDFKGLNQRRGQLLRALGYALQDNYVDVIHAFNRLPLSDLLDQPTLEAVALAKYHKGKWAVEDALRRGFVQVVKAHCEVLRSLAHRLPRAVLLEALQMEAERTLEGKTHKQPFLNWALFLGESELVAAVLSVFQEIKTFKEFEGLWDADTISHLLISPDGEGLSAVDRSLQDNHRVGGLQVFVLQAFVKGFLACQPSRSVVFALLAQAGEKLRQAIDHGRRGFVAAFLHMVSFVQAHPDYKLGRKEAWALGRMMRSARKQPVSFFPCLWVERGAYKQLFKHRHCLLRHGFEELQRELESS